jgi:hypothetical protein
MRRVLIERAVQVAVERRGQEPWHDVGVLLRRVPRGGVHPFRNLLPDSAVTALHAEAGRDGEQCCSDPTETDYEVRRPSARRGEL